NDIAIESCDLLLRKMFDDNLSQKNMAIIGTGNLASKIALRMAERQARVFIEGRSKEKEKMIINGINSFLPAYTSTINTMNQWDQAKPFDAVISFLSGPYWAESKLLPSIKKETLIVDGGISNFSSEFIQSMLKQDVNITRLDVRFALPYQFMDTMQDTTTFYEDIYGIKNIGDHSIVAGGYIGHEGSIIVDQIKRPTQIIGIADGMGGVKSNNDLSGKDHKAIEFIQDTIKAGCQIAE